MSVITLILIMLMTTVAFAANEDVTLSKVSDNTYLCNQNIATNTYEVTFRTTATEFTGNEITIKDNISTSKVGSTIYATTNILI